MCRSRRELSNEYLLAKFGVDTAENEPCKVCPLSVYRSLLLLLLQIADLTLCGIDVFDLAGLVIVRLDSPFVLHFVKFLESFGQSMDSWSSLVARENRCNFEYV